MSKPPIKCAFCGRKRSELDPQKEMLIALKADTGICICSLCVENAKKMPNVNEPPRKLAKITYLGEECDYDDD